MFGQKHAMLCGLEGSQANGQSRLVLARLGRTWLGSSLLLMACWPEIMGAMLDFQSSLESCDLVPGDAAVDHEPHPIQLLMKGIKFFKLVHGEALAGGRWARVISIWHSAQCSALTAAVSPL